MEDRENTAGVAPWYCAGNLTNNRKTHGRSQARQNKSLSCP